MTQKFLFFWYPFLSCSIANAVFIWRELNIDSMKTEWVKVCIRPEQSFTRAILEIYMNDGGTLGEVSLLFYRFKNKFYDINPLLWRNK